MCTVYTRIMSAYENKEFCLYFFPPFYELFYNSTID